MISDRNFSSYALSVFLKENDNAFTMPLSESLKKQGMTVDEYAEKLSNKATIAYEKEDSGVILGAVIGYTHDLPEDGSSYITQVVTDKKYRGRGIFKLLIKEYLDFCIQKNISYVWLTTGVNNTIAQKAYESVGFKLADNNGKSVKYIYTIER